MILVYSQFLGYQEDGLGGYFPLFNIVDPFNYTGLHESTVGIKSLVENNIPLPKEYPTYQEWFREKIQ